MAEKRTCEECGAELPANAPQGLCPRCLAKMGLGLLRTAVVPEPDFQIERTGTMIGRYKLLEKIGEGGFGLVYMAEQVEPVQRKVALKIIKAGMDTKEVIARFEAERQAIALMDHPNIARALDAGATEAGRPYFVMELVRGIPITEYCDQNHLSTRERLQLFIKVCQAVQHAHQKGVIHRDLKPSNVLVTEHDGEPVPKVIDFGVAKALGQRLTEKTLFTGFHHMVGTPAYMSPEQAALSGLDLDTRADIYSLGVLLYELLTGVTPFDADTFRKAALDEIRRMIRETEPPKPSTRLQTLGEKLTEVARHRHTEPAVLSRLVRGDLDWIVMKCLEKDRKRRYETANGLAMDVKRHLNSESVTAGAPSRLHRLQKFVRRNRVASFATVAVALSLVTGLAVAIMALNREHNARQNETVQRAKAQTAEQSAEIQAQHALTSEARTHRILYAAEMNLASEAVNEGNLKRARALLDRYRPEVERRLAGNSKASKTSSPAGQREDSSGTGFVLTTATNDLRGWEWRYLWQRARGAGAVFLSVRPSRATSLAFSFNGRLLAVGKGYRGVERGVELWDVSSRSLQGLLFTNDQVNSIAFSPLRNLLACAVLSRGRNNLKLYDLDSRQETQVTNWPCSNEQDCLVRDLAFTPDGQMLTGVAQFSPSGDGRFPNSLCFVLDSVSGRLLTTNIMAMTWQGPIPKGFHVLGTNSILEVLVQQAGSFEATRLDRTHNRIFAGGRTRLEIYEADTGRLVERVDASADPTSKLRQLGILTAGPPAASIMDLSPDGKYLATEGITIWEVEGLRAVVLLTNHTGRVTQIAFSPDGQMLASSSEDRTVRLWETGTWRPLRALYGAGDSVDAMSFSRDGRRLAVADRDGSVILLDTSGETSSRHYGRDRPERGNASEFFDDGLFSEDRNLFIEDGRWWGNARCRNLETGEKADWNMQNGEKPSPEFGEKTVKRSQIFPPNWLVWLDGKAVLRAAFISLTEFRSELAVPGVTNVIIHDPNTPFSKVVWASQDGLVAWVTGDSQIHLADGPTGQRLADFQTDLERPEFSYDPSRPGQGGQIVCLRGRDGQARFVNLRAREVIFKTKIVPEWGFAGATSAGTFCFWQVDDSHVCIWRSEERTNAPVTVDIGGLARSVCCTPDRRLLAFSTLDGVVAVVDTRLGQTIRRCHSDFAGIPVEAGLRLNSGVSMAISSEGQRLATGTRMGGLTLWDVESTQPLLTISGGVREPKCVWLSHDGRFLVIQEPSGRWQYWRAPTFAEIDELERTAGVWRMPKE